MSVVSVQLWRFIRLLQEDEVKDVDNQLNPGKTCHKYVYTCNISADGNESRDLE